jgi:hypothetical protein
MNGKLDMGMKINIATHKAQGVFINKILEEFKNLLIEVMGK